MRIVIWVLVVLLTVVFVYVGVAKVTGRWTGLFRHWGYPPFAAPAVGVIEILAGLALLVPRSRRVAAGILVAVMLGAVATHLIHGEVVRIILPLVLSGFALVIGRGSGSAAQSR